MLRSLCRSQNRAFLRSISLGSGIEAVDRAVASRLIEHGLEATNGSDAPSTVCEAERSKWHWESCLGETPRHSLAELNALVLRARDPFQLVEADVRGLSGGIKDLLGSDHPLLEQCAKYFFEIDGGKKIRPVMVLAVSYALSMHGNGHHHSSHGSNNKASSSSGTASASALQRRLAEITEMIHTASLFHDDVIDKAATRRGVPSVNQVFGNKLAILGGDFLLSRASVALARLKSLEVVELLSTVIEHLVKGEVMQMKPYEFDFTSEATTSVPSSSSSSLAKPALEYYLRKNFYKTASLMGNSSLAAAVLGGHSTLDQRACYLYGTYVGQAFQLIDDALDFEGSLQAIGKAPLADIRSGLATAPILFAAEEFPKLITLIGRKFEAPGDVDEAVLLVGRSQGIARTKALAQVHSERAMDAIMTLKQSEARDALIALACKVVTRSH